MNPRRLYRSHDRQLAGVAGGMAEYLDVDPTVVRILWILAALFSGGILILGYIILAIVIPQAPYPSMPGQAWSASAAPGTGPGAATWGTAGAPAPAWSPDWAGQSAAEREARERSRGRGPGAAVIVGVILVVFGVIALADNVVPGWVGAAVFGPALVVALGAALLVASMRRNDGGVATSSPMAAGVGSAPSGTPAAPGASPTAVPDLGPAMAAAYDADATASVDLGVPADPTASQPDTDPR